MLKQTKPPTNLATTRNAKSSTPNANEPTLFIKPRKSTATRKCTLCPNFNARATVDSEIFLCDECLNEVTKLSTQELQEALRKLTPYATLPQEIRLLLSDRAHAIRQAHSTGLSTHTIATALNLTESEVRQICQNK